MRNTWHPPLPALALPGTLDGRRNSRFEGALAIILMIAAATACDSGANAPGDWAGTVDTLATGQVVVHNPAVGTWRPGEAWRVEEEVRIGRLDGEGPDLFGNITSFEIDPTGRFWVFDGQAQELRVFAATGEHVRTIGRRGEGPEEFAQAVRVELGPDGNMWVMDPQNNRLSVVDSAGVFVGSHRALGGFIMLPWPGRFDDRGYYYSPVPLPGGEAFRIGLMRSDITFTEADTLEVPTDPVEREAFEHSTGTGSFIRAAVPFQGGFRWRLSPTGTMTAIVTDQYRFFELDATGDTLRTITRDFTPLPVTQADRDRTAESMEWFTSQGGRFDASRLPRVKAATRDFFQDDTGHLWVALVTADGSDREFDIFDPDGRYLGMLELPFRLMGAPVIRDGMLHGVVRDELDVSYVVRARIEKAGAGGG